MIRVLPVILVALTIPAAAYGYGEGSDIPEGSRVIHLLTNEARTNTREALAACGNACSEGLDCHAEVLAPLYWDDGLYRAAQFHANMLNAIDSSEKTPCMQHNSPCKLRTDAAAKYPYICDGAPGCACESGTAACGSSGTSTSERVKMFASGYSAENLASTSSKPYDAFMLWLYENANGSGCEWNTSNGHRFNILGGSKSIGVGYTKAREGKYYGIASQDFSGAVPSDPPVLTAGAGYRDNNALWFKTHYYAETPASAVSVTINGVKTDLAKTRGTETHGIYGSKDIEEPDACAQYYFEATDTSGKTTRFPTSGVLLYNCDRSWAGASSGGDSDSDCSAAIARTTRWSAFALLAALSMAIVCFGRRRKAN